MPSRRGVAARGARAGGPSGRACRAARRRRTGRPSSRVSSSASWPAESRHSRGPACSVCGVDALEQLVDGVGGQRRGAQVALDRARRARRAGGWRRARGRASAPSRAPGAAGTTRTPTGRSTRVDGRAAARRRARSQVGEAIRQQRRSSASKRVEAARAPSARGRRPACSGEAEPAGERARAGRRAWHQTRGVVEVDRQLRVRAARARASSSSAGTVTRVQSRPAARSAAAWPSISARDRLRASGGSARRAVMPWRRRTAWACWSRLLQASGSLGSTGSPCARRDERGPAQVVERGQPAREAAHELAAGVGRARLAGERLALGARRARRGSETGRRRGRRSGWHRTWVLLCRVRLPRRVRARGGRVVRRPGATRRPASAGAAGAAGPGGAEARRAAPVRRVGQRPGPSGPKARFRPSMARAVARMRAANACSCARVRCVATTFVFACLAAGFSEW